MVATIGSIVVGIRGQNKKKYSGNRIRLSNASFSRLTFLPCKIYIELPLMIDRRERVVLKAGTGELRNEMK